MVADNSKRAQMRLGNGFRDAFESIREHSLLAPCALKLIKLNFSRQKDAQPIHRTIRILYSVDNPNTIQDKCNVSAAMRIGLG